MATSGKLEVQIGADKSDFDKKIKEVEFDIQQLSKVKLEKIRLGLDTTEINSQIKDAKNNLNQLKSAVKDSGQSFNNFKPAVANGGNALMQFSRIAQDAPFGIIGIGNNITATVEAFSALQNSTGSTGGALKALGSSILGSGGILLGVSLLTTGLTYLAQSGMTVGDVIDKLTGQTDVYGNALKKATTEAYNSSEVVKAVESVKQLTTEVDLAKRGFISKAEVVKHYNETMGLTTGIVKTVDEVEQQLVKNGDAYIKMTLYKAVASLAQAQAAKDLLDSEKKANSSLKDNLGVLGNLMVAVAGTGLSYQNFSKAFSKAEKNRKEAVDESTASMKANLAIAEKYNKMAAELAKSMGFNFFQNNKPAPQTFNTPQVSPVSTLTPSGIKPFNVEPVKASIIGLANTVDAQNTRMLVALNDFNTQAANIIQNSIANTFIGLGEAIGSSLANGSDVLQSVGASLLSSLGSILTEMGKMAIQIGVGLIAVKFALKSLNPAAAIGAGVALIALGSLFKAQSSSIGGRIGGGGGVSGSSGSGANNSSFTSSGFASSGGGTVVFEIAGTKLIGVLSNTINSNKRLGGQLGLG